MASTPEHEVSNNLFPEVEIVLPSGERFGSKNVFSVDINGSDYTVKQSKTMLLEELSIPNADDYDLVIVKKNNSTIPMRDNELTIDHLFDLTTVSHIRIERRT